jgi:hypothetical protein
VERLPFLVKKIPEKYNGFTMENARRLHVSLGADERKSAGVKTMEIQ